MSFVYVAMIGELTLFVVALRDCREPGCGEFGACEYIAETLPQEYECLCTDGYSGEL